MVKHAMAMTEQFDSQLPAHAGDRLSALKAEHIADVYEVLAEHGQASLEETADGLDRRCGVRVCTLPAAPRP